MDPLRGALLMLPLLAAAGCGPFVMLAPDSHGDMDRRLDEIALPDGFVQVGRARGGLRSRFAAASAPYVARTFVAPWKDRALCEVLAAIADTLGELEPEHPAARTQGAMLCTFQRRIGAGWTARLVGVSSYRLRIQASSRAWVRRNTSDAKCRDELRRLGSTSSLSLPCRLLPGQAKVEFKVTGRQVR